MCWHIDLYRSHDKVNKLRWEQLGLLEEVQVIINMCLTGERHIYDTQEEQP